MRKIITGLLLFLSAASLSGCGSEFGVFFDDDSGGLGGYRVFWAEASGELKKAGTDGVYETILTVLGTPLDVAIYALDEKIYWTEYSGSDYQIKSAGLDGDGESVFYTPPNSNHGPSSIAIDSGQAYIYWNRYLGNNDVYRMPLGSGTAVKWVSSFSYNYSFCIALDTVNRKIYVTANEYWFGLGSGNDGEIRICELDSSGGPGNQFWAEGPSADSVALKGIAVDGGGGHIFFVDNNSLKIIRANLDFNGREDWITASGFEIEKLALDLHNRKIYWTSPGTSAIYRADMDVPESGIELFYQGASRINGIVIHN